MVERKQHLYVCYLYAIKEELKWCVVGDASWQSYMAALTKPYLWKRLVE
jgi:hypothetical protein